MAVEDVGILTRLLKRLCKPLDDAQFNMAALGEVARLYEEIRIPRTTGMLAASTALGDMQLARSRDGWFAAWAREMQIWWQVKRHGTLPIMWQGSGYHYSRDVDARLRIQRSKL